MLSGRGRGIPLCLAWWAVLSYQRASRVWGSSLLKRERWGKGDYRDREEGSREREIVCLGEWHWDKVRNRRSNWVWGIVEGRERVYTLRQSQGQRTVFLCDNILSIQFCYIHTPVCTQTTMWTQVDVWGKAFMHAHKLGDKGRCGNSREAAVKNMIDGDRSLYRSSSLPVWVACNWMIITPKLWLRPCSRK